MRHRTAFHARSEISRESSPSCSSIYGIYHTYVHLFARRGRRRRRTIVHLRGSPRFLTYGTNPLYLLRFLLVHVLLHLGATSSSFFQRKGDRNVMLCWESCHYRVRQEYRREDNRTLTLLYVCSSFFFPFLKRHLWNRVWRCILLSTLFDGWRGMIDLDLYNTSNL